MSAPAPATLHAYDFLRAANAPPLYLYKPPRCPAHGQMLAMLRGIHRFPPLQATASNRGRIPLDHRILSSIGGHSITLGESNMPGFWERFAEIQARYIDHANT